MDEIFYEPNEKYRFRETMFFFSKEKMVLGSLLLSFLWLNLQNFKIKIELF